MIVLYPAGYSKRWNITHNDRILIKSTIAFGILQSSIGAIFGIPKQFTISLNLHSSLGTVLIGIATLSSDLAKCYSQFCTLLSS